MHVFVHIHLFVHVFVRVHVFAKVYFGNKIPYKTARALTQIRHPLYIIYTLRGVNYGIYCSPHCLLGASHEPDQEAAPVAEARIGGFNVETTL